MIQEQVPKHSQKDIEGLRKSGKIVAKVLLEMINMLRPGISPFQLDQTAEKFFKQLNAKSAPRMTGFPGNTCISVNEIIAHGVPSKKLLKCGDRVNIDISAVHQGYFGDVAYTVLLGNDKHETNALLECAKKATMKAVEMSVAGTKLNSIAKNIEEIVRQHNFTIVKNLCSHGVGKSLHAYPENIINYYDPEETLALQEGMVIAWEPYVSNCAVRAIEVEYDEWGLTTHNNSDVAQFEHTVLVTKGKPEILTILD